MIVTEPAQPPGTSRRAAIGKRELNRFLVRAIQAVGLQGTVSVLLTGDAQIRELNRQYRRKDKATDVLSFPAADLGTEAPTTRQPRLAGDLAISLETAARQADAFGHSLQLEVKILLLHGLLHLAGFDHEVDSGQMARRETRLRKQLELPSGLIQRSSNPAANPPKRVSPRKDGVAKKKAAKHRAPQAGRSRAQQAGPAAPSRRSSTKAASRKPKQTGLGVRSRRP